MTEYEGVTCTLCKAVFTWDSADLPFVWCVECKKKHSLDQENIVLARSKMTEDDWAAFDPSLWPKKVNPKPMWKPLTELIDELRGGADATNTTP